MKNKKMQKMQSVAPTQESAESSNNLYLYGVPLCIALITLLCYIPSLRYSFQFDDLASITKYFHIRNKTFSELFFVSSRWISYWINTLHYKIGKFNPFGYRLFNVCLHTITSLFVFAFVYYALSRLRTKNFFWRHAFGIATITSALFALHPVQTQTVSYVIQGQLEGMAGFFMTSIALCFLFFSYTQDISKKIGWMVLVFLLAFLGTGSKEVFIVMPLLLLLVDWFFVAQGDWQQLKNRLPFHGCIFAIIFFSYLYLLKPDFFKKFLCMDFEAKNNIGNILTENKTDKILPLPFFISQFKVILHYIGMFIWPFNICVEYDWKLSKGFFAPDAFFPFIGVCLLLLSIIYLLRSNKTHVLAFGGLWFLIVLAPRSIIPSSELMTDYKTYGGAMGLLLIFASAIVWVVDYCYQHWFSNKQLSTMQLHAAVMVLLALPISLCTWQRNKVWRSGEEFWANIIQNAPGKARAYNNYAVAMSEQRKFKESIPYYAKAIEMDPYYPDPINNIAVAYSMIGDLDRGIAYLKKSIQMQPNYPEGYNNLASFLIQKKEYAEAEKLLLHAIKLRPHYGKAYFNLGKTYLAQSMHEKAQEAFKNSCTKADLDIDAEPFKIWGKLSMALKKYDEAYTAFSRVLEFEQTTENIFNLANACFLNGKASQAVHWYGKLLATNPGDQRIIYNLAEAYAKLGDYQAALDNFMKAKNAQSALPSLPLRIAACLKELNRQEEARKVLEECANTQDMPDTIKLAARAQLQAMT